MKHLYLARLFLFVYLCCGATTTIAKDVDSISAAIGNNLVMCRMLHDMATETLISENATIEKYILEKGDSWESLGYIRGCAPYLVESLNKILPEPIAGYEIELPSYPPYSIGDERRIIWSDSRYDTAQNHIDNQEWDKAVDIYNKILPNKPSLTGFYNRGIAQLNRHKFKQAISDLEWVNERDKYGLFCESTEYLAMARDAWEEIKQERAENWLNIIGAVAEIGVQVTSTYIEAKQNNNLNSNSNFNCFYPFPSNVAQMSEYEQSEYYNGVFKQIMNQTITEFNMENQREYELVRQNYLNIGKDLSYEEFMAIKAQAYAMTESDSSYNSDVDSQSKINYSSADILNQTVGKYCGLCKGKKKCHACGGSKVASGFGLSYHCSVCNDSGDCPKCNGTGLASWNQ